MADNSGCPYPPRGYVDPNFPRPVNDDSACIIIYGYTPSFALCIAGLVLFAIALVAHVVQLARYRTWYFTPIVVGIALEMVGYVSRALSSRRNPYSVTYFVIQYFFIVTAPVMFSVSQFWRVGLWPRSALCEVTQ